MPRHLHIDVVGGLSGDMTLAGLIDLGVPGQAITQMLAGLAVGPFDIEVREARQHTLRGLQVHVAVPGAEASQGAGGQGGYHHDHGHAHGHGAGHEHGHRDGGHPHRHWPEIQAMVANAALPERVGVRALAIFEALARAEAKMHGVAMADVHFHEVGAVDSIVDIVGAAAALEMLGVESVSCGPVPLAPGMVMGGHGPIPLPGPAVLELLKGFEVTGVAEPGETVTPTGAAILRGLCGRASPCPAMRLEGIGVGIGHREMASRPNMARFWLGERDAAPAGTTDEVVELAANLDDMAPEIMAFALEGILAEGALDAWAAPIVMKKGRPAYALHALARGEDAGRIELGMLRETSTLGVRRRSWGRRVLFRRTREVTTAYGVVAVKEAAWDAEFREVVHAAPEFESAKALALAVRLPLQEIYAATMAVYREQK